MALNLSIRALLLLCRPQLVTAKLPSIGPSPRTAGGREADWDLGWDRRWRLVAVYSRHRNHSAWDVVGT